jgi:hypothetical protein
MDRMAVVVELASRIQDLPRNKYYELLRHGHDLIHLENFAPYLHHLSFYKNEARYINYSRQHN